MRQLFFSSVGVSGACWSLACATGTTSSSSPLLSISFFFVIWCAVVVATTTKCAVQSPLSRRLISILAWLLLLRQRPRAAAAPAAGGVARQLPPVRSFVVVRVAWTHCCMLLPRLLLAVLVVAPVTWLIPQMACPVALPSPLAAPFSPYHKSKKVY